MTKKKELTETELRWVDFKDRWLYMIQAKMREVAFTCKETILRTRHEIETEYKKELEEFLAENETTAEELLSKYKIKCTWEKVYDEAIYTIQLIEDDDRV